MVDRRHGSSEQLSLAETYPRGETRQRSPLAANVSQPPDISSFGKSGNSRVEYAHCGQFNRIERDRPSKVYGYPDLKNLAWIAGVNYRQFTSTITVEKSNYYILHFDKFTMIKIFHKRIRYYNLKLDLKSLDEKKKRNANKYLQLRNIFSFRFLYFLKNHN